MPTTWMINGLGLAALLVSGVLALVTLDQVDALAIKGIAVDWKTGSFFSKGGAIADLNKLETACNMGHVSFVHRNNVIDVDHVREHEAGHALSSSAFGRFAEGNVPFDSPGRPQHPMWSWARRGASGPRAVAWSPR